MHQPHQWGKNPDYRKNRPEIFQLEKDGKRNTGPMLCYGNPKTLETYLERVDEELKGGQKSDILNGNAVTVSPWDCAVACNCDHCRALFDPKAGSGGSASKIMCAFVRKLSDALAKSHPELKVVFLPYLNYCDVPEGAAFPAGNVEVQLCSMPGLAMFKEPAVKAHEERLIRRWMAVTGRKIQNWHYICWPAEFTSAPYLYGDTIVRHYQDTHDATVGSFVNGCFWPEERHFLSAYLWARALWNYNLKPPGGVRRVRPAHVRPAAAAPMRRLIQMQEDGWSRHWTIPSTSPKNIHGVSYPRADVLEMERLFAEAYKLAGGDALVKMRLDYYRKGFESFFKESKEYAEGTAFAPLMMQKASANPAIDGKLDDADWQQAPPLGFVKAFDKQDKAPAYPTTVQALWTPDGVTFGFRMVEPTPDKLFVAKPSGSPESFWNDNVELLFDVTGKGAGDFFQVIVDARDEELFSTHSTDKEGWRPEGVKHRVFRGKDFWSAEVFVPFAAFAKVDGAQLPLTSSAGMFWLGNFCRHRVADSARSRQGAGQPQGDAALEHALRSLEQRPELFRRLQVQGVTLPLTSRTATISGWGGLSAARRNP